MWGDRIYPSDIRENPVIPWNSQFETAEVCSAASKSRPFVTRVATVELSGNRQAYVCMFDSIITRVLWPPVITKR